MKILMKQHNRLFDFKMPEKKVSEKSSLSDKKEEIDSFL